MCSRAEGDRLVDLFVSRAAPHTLHDVQMALSDFQLERSAMIRRACASSSPLDTPITLHELQTAYKTSKDTAPGRDGIVYSLISHLGPLSESVLLELFNRSLNAGLVPSPWKYQVTVPIPKHGDMQNPRPISLLCCVGKTKERILLPRFMHQVGPLLPNMYAFRQGVGTQDCLTNLLAHVGCGPALTV